MLNALSTLCGLDGISGNEAAVRTYIEDAVKSCPGILETRTDALGNFLVHKKGKNSSSHTVMISAHMDEVGLIVTEIRPDGTLAVEAVGGVDADVVIGRQVQIGNMTGVVGSTPVHKLSAKQREQKPTMKDLFVDIGAASKEEAEQYVQPGDAVCFAETFEELGGNRVVSKAIDDRFGCAVMLDMLEGEIPMDAWFAFCVQEEIGLRGSRTAAYAINPDFALVLEATTAADLDGVRGGDCVCRLGGGPVVSFMDRSTIYDKELYRTAMETAKELGIPCQTKSRVAGGNDAGAIHLTRDGVRTLAISVPCRYLHSPSCVAQKDDMEGCERLALAMLEKIQNL